jgi:cation transport regulator ChaC
LQNEFSPVDYASPFNAQGGESVSLVPREREELGVTWIFAYGSLMGDNAMRFYQGTPARLPGFHRAFNHASTRRWGSEAHPCPILGLSPDGECQGVAFEIPRSDVRDVLRKIERREAQEEFQRKRVRVQLPHGSDTKALVWVTRNGLLQSPRWPRDPNQLDSERPTASSVPVSSTSGQ